MSFVEIADKYAKDVLLGEQPACKWVKLACERYQNDRKLALRAKSDFIFKPNLVEIACGFMELLPHVEGIWATKGMKLKLQPWQVFILANLFGFYLRKPKDGKIVRRFRECYIEVPRKNGKTIFAAGLALLIMTLDKEAGAKLFCGATSLDQANILFNTAKGMISRAPDIFNENSLKMIVHSRSIMHETVDDTGAKDVRHFNSLVRTPKDGTNPHFAVIDEYHEHQTDALVSSLRTGMGARAQPLLVEITTAGYDIASPCFTQRHVVTQILRQAVKADDFFGIIYTIDDGDDWESLDSWKKANPNYGVSVSEEDVERTLSLARQVHTKQSEAKVKRLNIWGQASEGFLDMRRWHSLGDNKLRLADFKGRKCYMGFDLSAKHDLTSLCMLFPDPENNEKVTCFWRNWLPQGTIDRVENEHYRRFEGGGWLTRMQGDSIRHAQLEQEFLEYVDLFDVQGFAYDPWGMRELAEWLEEQRPTLNLYEFKQMSTNTTPPLRDLENMVINGDIIHEDNPIINWMAGNLLVTEGNHKLLKINKNKTTRSVADKNKIDGMMALVMAIGLWKNDENTVSIYDRTDKLVY